MLSSRCIWMEMNLGDMFPGMVDLLQHLGLACRTPKEEASADPEDCILVPWFLSKSPESLECWPKHPPQDEVSNFYHSRNSPYPVIPTLIKGLFLLSNYEQL